MHQSALLWAVSGLTCAEQQEDLHAQVLVMGDLQADELAGDLQHQLALVRHVGQLHPLPGGGTRTNPVITIHDQFPEEKNRDSRPLPF